MKLVFRSPRDDSDRNFVAITWRASFRRSPYAGLISMASWADVMDVEINNIIARPRVQILVAADLDATDRLADLFGYVVWERASIAALPLVYFLYVKHGARGNGIARGLLKSASINPAAPFNFVCRTHATDSLRDAGKLPHARWRPLLGRVTEGDRHGSEDRESAEAP